MALSQLGGNQWICDSTDTLPYQGVTPGSRVFQRDRGYWKIWHDGAWQYDVNHTISDNFAYQVADKHYACYEPWYKIGYNPDCAVTQEDLWPVGGTIPLPAANMRMAIKSGATDDQSASAGNGVRTVRLKYLDSSFDEHTTVLVMNGTTSVKTAESNIYRVQSLRAVTVGSAGAAVGAISLGSTDYAATYTQISSAHNRARNSLYTVPAGHNLFITYEAFSAFNKLGDAAGRFFLHARYDEDASATCGFWKTYSEIGIMNQGISFDLPSYIRFPQHTEIKISFQGGLGVSSVVTGSVIRGFLEHESSNTY